MLLEKINSDLKEALKAGEMVRVATVRLLLAEIHNREMQKQQPLTEEEIVAVIRQQAKLRQEAIPTYEKAGRSDLADKEKQEMTILNKYLPQSMGTEELENIVKETITDLQVAGPKDFGKVMGAVMAKVKGKAEGNQVSVVVKKQLEVFS